jgi:hypothetical protein
MVSTVHFDAEPVFPKKEIDNPRTESPLPMELAAQHPTAKGVQNRFQFLLSRCVSFLPLLSTALRRSTTAI